MKTAFTFLTLAAILLATSPARAIDRFWSCHQVTACNYWWSPSTVVTSDFLSATDLTGQVTYGYVWPQVTSCLQTTTCEWAPPGSW